MSPLFEFLLSVVPPPAGFERIGRGVSKVALIKLRHTFDYIVQRPSQESVNISHLTNAELHFQTEMFFIFLNHRHLFADDPLTDTSLLVRKV